MARTFGQKSVVDKLIRADTGKTPLLGPTVLVVSGASQFGIAGRGLPLNRNFTFADFDDISYELIESLAPDFVISPLLSRSFDCQELAQVLHSLGYSGRYRVLTAMLPNPMLVKSEIRNTTPGLDFDLFLTRPAPKERLH